jgi:myosin heavy subunit
LKRKSRLYTLRELDVNVKKQQDILVHLLHQLVTGLDSIHFDYRSKALPPMDAELEEHMNMQHITAWTNQINRVLVELVKSGITIPDIYYKFASNELRLMIFDEVAQRAQQCDPDKIKEIVDTLKVTLAEKQQLFAELEQAQANINRMTRRLAEKNLELEQAQEQLAKCDKIKRKMAEQVDAIHQQYLDSNTELDVVKHRLRELMKFTKEKELHISELNELTRTRDRDIELEVQRRIKEQTKEYERAYEQATVQLQTQLEQDRRSNVQLQTQLEQQQSVSNQHERQRIVCQEALARKETELSDMQQRLTETQASLERYVNARSGGLYRAVSPIARAATGRTPLARTPGAAETPLAQPGELADVEYFTKGKKRRSKKQ